MDKSTKDWFQYGLATVMVAGFFTILGMLVYQSVPVENKDAMNILLGILAGAVGSIIGYFYGSSKGSSEKNEMLAERKPGA